MMQIQRDFPDEFLTENEVAKMTGFALSTLRNHRFLKKGLPYVKATNRMIRYSLRDVLRYMADHRIETEPELIRKGKTDERY